MMKRILILMVWFWVGASAIPTAYGQVLRSLPVGPTPDTGTYVVGTRNVGGSFYTYRWSMAQMTAYIGSIGAADIATASRTATGDYLQQWAGYNLAFNGVKDVTFTGTTGNYTYFLASGKRVLINNHSSGAIMDVKDGGVSGSDTVAIKGWPRLPATSPNEFVTVDAAGNWCHSAVSVPVSVNKAALLGQTGAITASSYPSVTNAWYEVKGFVNVTNIATDVLNVQVIFTDENGSMQTKLIPAVNSAGTAAVNMGSVDHYSFSMPVYGKTATTIRVSVLLATGGGSDTYDIYVNTVKQ